MLRLSNIKKDYPAGDSKVEALQGISLAFRKSEFVSILGPSGCGKTTLLNIIGGLDRYTSGDLFINDVSTKEYADVDWDIYRNTSIGFVFQNYNLISHQTVLSNVELALTLAGISKEERRRRATAVLKQVGLGDQIHKKPNQMSGGQMQRVAIARALVNNPEILLADEPTGALDSETSTQIMALLKEIAKDRLVLMVTHNAELAEAYSTRIIRLLDGKVLSDTNPYQTDGGTAAKPKKTKKTKKDKVSMSFFTALSLSLNNLLTKKTRTILTAFAGSIGIIGIALILSLSSGMNAHIDNIQRDTLSTYPIEIESQSVDLTGMMSSMMDTNNRGGVDHDLDAVYSNNITTDMVSTVSMQVTRNDLGQFKAYLESEEGAEIRALSTTIQYGYDLDPQVYATQEDGSLLRVNPSSVYESLGISTEGGIGRRTSDIWDELLGDESMLTAQYDVIAGTWAGAYDEIMIVVNGNNELSDMVLYSLGLMDVEALHEMTEKAARGEETEPIETARFPYDELLGLRYTLVPQSDRYTYDGETGQWVDRSEDDAYMRSLVQDGVELKVVGILRPSEEPSARTISGSVVYISALTEYIAGQNELGGVVKAQRMTPEIDVLTGMPFDVANYAESLTMDDLYALIAEMPEDEQAQVSVKMAGMSDAEILAMMEEMIKSNAGTASYAGNMAAFGVIDYDSPSAINIYPTNFEAKERITAQIDAYNAAQKDAGKDEYVIHYTDIMGMMISSVTSIIDIISYVLIAFVSISLVVSSIMIGIITYISVLERTKEIGILRSIGASKKDISRVFNAETTIVGLVAGGLGIGITTLLNIPINLIIKALTGVSGIASLPLYGAVSLVVISVALTLIAGLIPSRLAAKKDPVEALRTE